MTGAEELMRTASRASLCTRVSGVRFCCDDVVRVVYLAIAGGAGGC